MTNPAKPKELGRFPTGVTTGVHEVGIVQRPDGRVLALAAVPYSFNLSQGRQGDLRIIEITDPAGPGARRLGRPPRRPGRDQGQLAARRDVFAHSAWPFDKGNKLFASFWSTGVQFLDIRDPAAPRLIGQTLYRPEDGYRGAHSGWFNKDETLFVQNDEAMQAVGSGSRRSWTFQRVFDTSSLEQPKLLSTFATESAVPGNDGQVATDGVYSVHNAVIEGDLEYASWYSDGVRWSTCPTPAAPARSPPSSRPPPRPASPRPPPRAAAATCPWSGAYPEGPVLASDMNSGLWVFRVTADAKAPNGGGSGQPATPPPALRAAPAADRAGDPGDPHPALGRRGRPAPRPAGLEPGRPQRPPPAPRYVAAADQVGAEQREGGHVDRQERVAPPPATASTTPGRRAAASPPGARDQTREPAFTPGSRSRRAAGRSAGCRPPPRPGSRPRGPRPRRGRRAGRPRGRRTRAGLRGRTTCP